MGAGEVERTLVFLKPEAIEKRLIGEILMRIERKGLRIRALKLHRMTRQEAEELYEPHKGKEFFERLIQHVISGPILLMVVEGLNAIKAVRQLVGATDPLDAVPGSIRGDYGLDITANIIHAADSLESAEREIRIFFAEEEIEAMWRGVGAR